MIYYAWVIDRQLLEYLLHACETPGFESDLKSKKGKTDDDENLCQLLTGNFIEKELAESLTQEYLEIFETIRSSRGLPSSGGSKFRFFWQGLPETLKEIQESKNDEVSGAQISEAVVTEIVALLNIVAGDNHLRTEARGPYLACEQLGKGIHWNLLTASMPNQLPQEERQFFGAAGRCCEFSYLRPEDGIQLKDLPAQLKSLTANHKGLEKIADLFQQAIDEEKVYIGHLSDEDVNYE